MRGRRKSINSMGAETHASLSLHETLWLYPQVIGNLWEPYLDLLKGGQAADNEAERMTEGKVMDVLGLKRFCCRRMIMTHVDLIVKLLNYNTYERVVEVEVSRHRAREDDEVTNLVNRCSTQKPSFFASVPEPTPLHTERGR